MAKIAEYLGEEPSGNGGLFFVLCGMRGRVASSAFRRLAMTVCYLQ
ncbi:hypothetical protein [Chryseobacterium sp.]|nr:hypothetical protein [Chryseobacterium sp.]